MPSGGGSLSVPTDRWLTCDADAAGDVKRLVSDGLLPSSRSSLDDACRVFWWSIMIL